MNYKIRNFHNTDIKSFAKMLGQTWDLGKRVTDAGSFCNWIYAFEILRVASEIIVLIDNNGCPVGFAGYNQDNNHRRWFWRILYRAFYNISFWFVKNRAALRAYYDVYDYAPDYIKKQFDAELTILIIDEKLQGLGLGKILFDEIVIRAKKADVKNLRIDTDDSCGVGFYVKSGCEEIYKNKAGKAGEAYTENVYVFGKKIKGT